MKKGFSSIALTHTTMGSRGLSATSPSWALGKALKKPTSIWLHNKKELREKLLAFITLVFCEIDPS